MGVRLGIIHSLVISRGKCCSRRCWWVFSRQTGNGLNIELRCFLAYSSVEFVAMHCVIFCIWPVFLLWKLLESFLRLPTSEMLCALVIIFFDFVVLATLWTLSIYIQILISFSARIFLILSSFLPFYFLNLVWASCWLGFGFPKLIFLIFLFFSLLQPCPMSSLTLDSLLLLFCFIYFKCKYSRINNFSCTVL